MKLNPWRNIFRLIVNANSIVEHAIAIKNEIIKHVNVNVKIIITVQKISWNLSTYICENSKYFKIFADTSVTDCYEIVIAMGNS